MDLPELSLEILRKFLLSESFIVGSTTIAISNSSPIIENYCALHYNPYSTEHKLLEINNTNHSSGNNATRKRSFRGKKTATKNY